jgi:hypothetical protein
LKTAQVSSAVPTVAKLIIVYLGMLY